MIRLVGVLALALIVYSIVMAMAVAGFPKQGVRHEIGPPVLTLELASSGEELSNLLDVKDYDARGVLRHDTHLDNFYIPTYTAFTLAFVWTMGRGSLRLAALFTAVLAAIGDGMENYHIFAALSASVITDATASAIRNPSLVKWAALDVTMLLTALMLFRRKEQPFSRKVNIALALLMSVAAIAGFGGLACRPLIPYSTYFYSALPIVCLSLLWRKQKES